MLKLFLKVFLQSIFFFFAQVSRQLEKLPTFNAHTHKHAHTQTFPEALCPLFIYPCDNMFSCFSPGGTRKRSSLIGLISMPKHPLCPAVPQLIVLGFGINNIYFSKSHNYLFLNLVLSVCLSVILFYVFRRPFLQFTLVTLRPSFMLLFFLLCSTSFRPASCKMCQSIVSFFLSFVCPQLLFVCLFFTLLSLMSGSQFAASFSIH